MIGSAMRIPKNNLNKNISKVITTIKQWQIANSPAKHAVVNEVIMPAASAENTIRTMCTTLFGANIFITAI